MRSCTSGQNRLGEATAKLGFKHNQTAKLTRPRWKTAPQPHRPGGGFAPARRVASATTLRESDKRLPQADAHCPAQVSRLEGKKTYFSGEATPDAVLPRFAAGE
jgi:hypothetical protein